MSGKVGLLGGAFDPPHAAHVALAELAIEVLGLNRLLVLPTGQPWHRDRPPSLAVHRVSMCQLAFRALRRVQVDDRETRRSGPTYTIDTVRELRAEQPGTEWYLIIGADQARRLDSWHQWEELLCWVHLAVAERDSQRGRWQNTAWEQATVLPWKPLNISATQIRHDLAQGLAVPALDEQVLGYIHQHQLYRTPAP
jgi:nicotinate-nucleotide adenylyltransferase